MKSIVTLLQRIARIGPVGHRTPTCGGVAAKCCGVLREDAFESDVSRQKQFSHALCPTCPRQNFPEYFTPAEP